LRKPLFIKAVFFYGRVVRICFIADQKKLTFQIKPGDKNNSMVCIPLVQYAETQDQADLAALAEQHSRKGCLCACSSA